ncbi:MAG: HD-GYP domain-containing protein [Chitinispirillaceae bacterium]|nr:HD-GYP domain-containing protein [Chitinispirillaceae bacterium]
MPAIPLSSLRPDSTAPCDYYSHKGELLIPQGATITLRHLKMLEQRNNFDLFTSPVQAGETTGCGTAVSDQSGGIVTGESERLFSTLLDAANRRDDIDIFNLEQGRAGLNKLNRSRIPVLLDNKLVRGTSLDRPMGTPLRNRTEQIMVAGRPERYKHDVHEVYRVSLQEVKNLLRLLARNNNADARAVEEIVRQFLDIFISDRNILLNISQSKPDNNGDYLFHHSLNVCLLAINVATSYGYSEKQVLEIGMGALVHDIGMLLLPGPLRMKHGRLTDQEWVEIQKHPVLGLYLLQNLKNMPERIPFITYQVHERENSTGYPRQRKSTLIHRYAKMVQVADIYEALTSIRPHRPPYTPSEAVVKIVQMSRKKLIPADAVRAFLEYVSLFPVGSLVELNDRRIAKVVHSNRESLNKPVISVLIDERGTYLPHAEIYQIDLSRELNVSIARTLPLESYASVDIMEGF